jgi:hypothetical protein
MSLRRKLPLVPTRQAEAAAPLVSCIMPTGNRLKFAELAIRCFTRQDYAARELIIVDDGTSPLSPALVGDSRIQYIRLTERHSTGAKRNLACRAARGDFIIQWDDDDWHGATRIRKQVEPLIRGTAEISGLADTLVLELPGLHLWAPAPHTFRQRALAGVHGGTLAYRRDIFDRVTCYPDASHGEDVGFLRPALVAQCRVAAIPGEDDFIYVRHGQNTSRMNEFYRRFGGRPAPPPQRFQADLPYYRDLQASHTSRWREPAAVSPKPAMAASPSPAKSLPIGGRPQNLAVITTHYNPCGFRRPRENYRRFAAGMQAAGVPLWTAELAYDDDPFHLPAGDRTLRLRGSRQLHFLWQKERLLNLLIERLPPEVDAIAWIDADVLFLNPHWVRSACQQLDSHAVVQLFADGFDLMPDGQLNRLKHSTGWALTQQLPDSLDFSRSHPGFAWAARTSLLRRHGLYDCMVTGSGDALMLAGFAGKHPSMALRLNPSWQAHLRRWAEGVARDSRGVVGYVPGSILHHWHGSRANRRYNERLTPLTRFNFDPESDLRLDENGLWAWSAAALRHKRAMIDLVRDYFAQRNEDA